MKSFQSEIVTVNYLGCRLEIPSSYQWLTIDEDGQVNAWFNRPNPHNGTWENVEERPVCVGWVDAKAEGLKPDDTLESVEHLRYNAQLGSFESSFRQVAYRGLILNIPEGYKYISVDGDGRVNAWKVKPWVLYDSELWVSASWECDSEPLEIGHIDPEFECEKFDWSVSLEEV